MEEKTKDQFTPELDCEIIRGYIDGREAMFERLENRCGLSRSAITKRAHLLGLTDRVIQQLSLSDVTYGPRSCLRCVSPPASEGSTFTEITGIR